MLLLIVFFLLMPPDSSVGEKVPGVTLQTSDFISPDAVIDSASTVIPDITKMTTCARVRLRHDARRGVTFLSYYVSEADYQMVLAGHIEKGVLSIRVFKADQGEGQVSARVTAPFKLFRWFHLCVAVDLSSKNYWVALNNFFTQGVLSENPTGQADTLEPVRLRGWGQFTIGQKQNFPGGGFSLNQALLGDVADFRLYDILLSPERMEDFARCRRFQANEKALLYFDSPLSLFEVRGSSNLTQFDVNEICRTRLKRIIIFPKKRTSEASNSLCEVLGGQMFLPKSGEENAFAYETFVQYSKECSNDEGAFLWLAAIGDPASGRWLGLEGQEPLTWDNFTSSENRAFLDQRCLSLGATDSQYEWMSSDCEETLCVACVFPGPPRLALRGLCKDSFLDRYFYLEGYDNGRPKFVGTYHSRISWKDNRWVLEHEARPEVSATYVPPKSEEFLLGLREWDFKGDRCQMSKVSLLLTVCRDGEFTCDDGTCVSRSSRCNLKTECPDSSDEEDCDPFLLPKGYSSSIPPPATTTKTSGSFGGRSSTKQERSVPLLPPPSPHEDPLPVKLAIAVTAFRNLDLPSFSMALELTSTLSWKDPRVRMRNLKGNASSNRIGNLAALWLPPLVVRDGNGHLVDSMERSQSLVARRTGEPLPDDGVFPKEDIIYDGRDFELALQITQTVIFSCFLDLRRYPFDAHACALRFKLDDDVQDAVVLVPQNVVGALDHRDVLLEYEVAKWNMSNFDLEDKNTIELTFEMRHSHISSVCVSHLPSFLLLFTCYLALYIHIDEFQGRLLLSLASMLIQASFFAQTSQLVPRTSYLKLIDIWFLFVITASCTVLSLIVVIERLRVQVRSPRVIKVLPEKSCVMPLQEPKRGQLPYYSAPTPWAQRINVASRVGLFAIIFIFFVLYVLVGVLPMNTP
ncbi:uncharacterized protein LOC143037664 [Oratosquilla oratoria]|uniref:uncharacterized protein LOC143037664 n=1 Tax=Oratosquilla oratoria TaxID=337810 RepID=UPI003F776624